ncbi:MAG: PIN domain-containing protein [Chloroflexota bacterium]|nr:PIN domain-containing protein [Chloroflexota bacterium]
MALRSFLEAHPRRFASLVAQVEVARAILRAGVSGAPIAEAFLGVEIIELDADVAARAAVVEPAMLRTLDAIHLVSALMVADQVDALVTYDVRLADAARWAGLTVVAPA